MKKILIVIFTITLLIGCKKFEELNTNPKLATDSENNEEEISKLLYSDEIPILSKLYNSHFLSPIKFIYLYIIILL